MVLNKKGLVFTIIAIMLINVLIFSSVVYNKYNLRDKSIIDRIRIHSMNNFLDDFEKDMQRGLYICGIRALLGMEEYVTNQGLFVEDTNTAFKEAFLNGTINNVTLNLTKESTFMDWIKKTKEEARKIDIICTFVINDVSIYHDDPWKVNVAVNLTLKIKDSKKIAEWTRDYYLTKEIGIKELEDPLYIISSYGRNTNMVVKANITDFVIGNDTTNLQNHLYKSYYIESNTAPSFLMRLEGNLSSSDYGIESLVNLEDLMNQGVPIRSRSVVDYIFFGNQSTQNYNIKNMPEWFKLDDEHLEVYQCEDLID